MTEALIALVGVALGVAITYAAARARRAGDEATRQAELARVLQEARVKAQEVEAEATARAAQAEREARDRVEEELRERRAEIGRTEQRLDKREANLDQRDERTDRRVEEIDRREESVRTKEETVEGQARSLAARLDEAGAALERISGMTRSQALDDLMARTADEARTQAASVAQAIEDQARDEAERRAKWVLGTAIQRYAGEYVSDRTTAVVTLPSDDVKGRIIGREGRNIRTIEAATQCDIIIDDTPESVVVSSFNPIRREIGRMTIERLVADGRIHPTRIEDTVKQCEAEIEEEIKKAGDRAVGELALTGVHAEIVKLLGRLKYRYSYAQNVWVHSVEVGFLSGMMAGELGLNVKLARRAGLLHDIGKAVDHEAEGGHAVIGGKIAKRFGERPEVVNAIAGHHDDVPAETVYTHLATAADALSGARPGARRETLASYVQRLEELEQLAGAFPGVDRAYALQAGREVRVIVEGSRIDDVGAVRLSREVARKIEEAMTYPGQIKVCVIRETRAIEFAK